MKIQKHRCTREEAVGKQKQQKYGEDLGDYCPLSTLQVFMQVSDQENGLLFKQKNKTKQDFNNLPRSLFDILWNLAF